MVPVGTTAMDWWCPAISLCWRCRPTARSSIQSSGFGTICAATGSPTRYFGASPTSWTPARWRGTGSPPTPAWSARSARSPGLRLRPIHSLCLLSNRGPDKKTHSRPEISGDPYKTPSGLVRGFGGPQVYFALEWLMQRIAMTLGLDPLEVIRRNLVETFPYRCPAGAVLDSGDYRTAVDVAATRGGLAELQRRRDLARTEGRLSG